MRRQLFTLALLLITTPARADEKIDWPMGSRQHLDLVYSKPDANTELHLDLARTCGNGRFPVVVYIHGGGWLIGDRKTYHSYMARTVQAGYVAVSIEYRLGKPFPAAIHDAKSAIRWLRANADRYGIDSERIGVVGYSAGGQLACLLGTTADNKELEGKGGCLEESSRVQAVAAYYALTDLAELYRVFDKQAWWRPERSKMLAALHGYCQGSLEEAKKTYTLASPITHVHKAAAAMFLIHGDRDTQVPVEQSQNYHQRLKKAGADVELLVVKEAGHNFVGEYEKAATEAMMRFFERRLKKR